MHETGCKVSTRSVVKSDLANPEENHAYLHVSIRSCFSREYVYKHAREREKRLTELAEHEDRKRDARAKSGSSSVREGCKVKPLDKNVRGGM